MSHSCSLCSKQLSIACDIIVLQMSLLTAANLLVNWVFKCSDPGLCFCQCVLEAPTLKAIKVIYDLGRFIYTAYTTFINIWYPGFSVATRRSRRVKKLSEPCQGVRFSPTRSGNRTSFTMFYHEAWQKERRRSSRFPARR